MVIEVKIVVTSRVGSIDWERAGKGTFWGDANSL